MKKKIGTLLLAATLLANVAMPAFATGFTGSPTLAPEVSDATVEDTGTKLEVVTDNVVTGGEVKEKGESETTQLEDIEYPVVKVTTVSMTISANATIDAANPGASAAQKNAMATDSALSYEKNAKTNAVASTYYSSETTSEFFRSYGVSAYVSATATVQSVATRSGAGLAARNLNNYRATQIADISASTAAIQQAGGSRVSVTFSAPGVKNGDLVLVAHFRNNGGVEFLSATAGNGSVVFSVNLSDLSPFMLLTYVEQ